MVDLWSIDLDGVCCLPVGAHALPGRGCYLRFVECTHLAIEHVINRQHCECCLPLPSSEKLVAGDSRPSLGITGGRSLQPLHAVVCLLCSLHPELRHVIVPASHARCLYA